MVLYRVKRETEILDAIRELVSLFLSKFLRSFVQVALNLQTYDLEQRGRHLNI